MCTTLKLYNSCTCTYITMTSLCATPPTDVRGQGNASAAYRRTADHPRSPETRAENQKSRNCKSKNQTIVIQGTAAQGIVYIAGNFHWCKFSYEQNYPFKYFVFLNIRTAQDSDVEPIMPE